MDWEGRRTVDNRKGRQKGRVTESDRTEEISSTEFPEGGGAIYTKAPRHPHGGKREVSF